jgi:transcriptional regulator with XRE-family HTH domain
LNLHRFGERVRDSRKAKERNWTLGRLAELCTTRGVAVSSNYLSIIERNQPHYKSGGEIQPREELVDVLIDLLDLPPVARLEAGYLPKDLIIHNVRLSLRLEPYLEVLSPEERERVESNIEEYTKNLSATIVSLRRNT